MTMSSCCIWNSYDVVCDKENRRKLKIFTTKIKRSLFLKWFSSYTTYSAFTFQKLSNSIDNNQGEINIKVEVGQQFWAPKLGLNPKYS